MEQFHAFLLCAACGIIGGALYDVFFCLAYPFKVKAVHIAADILFCIAFSVFYILFSTALALPPMRFYLLAGICGGFFLYLKSFHKTVAFFALKVYNVGVKIKNKFNKRKRKQKKCREKATCLRRKQRELR